jgi:hypothetical protein
MLCYSGRHCSFPCSQTVSEWSIKWFLLFQIIIHCKHGCWLFKILWDAQVCIIDFLSTQSQMIQMHVTTKNRHHTHKEQWSGITICSLPLLLPNSKNLLYQNNETSPLCINNVEAGIIVENHKQILKKNCWDPNEYLLVVIKK